MLIPGVLFGLKSLIIFFHRFYINKGYLSPLCKSTHYFEDLFLSSFDIIYQPLIADEGLFWIDVAI